MQIELYGTEETTLECWGTLDDDVARALLPPGFEPRTNEGGVEAGILVFRMVGLVPAGLPAAIGSSYGEALWRVGIVVDGEPAWYAVRCDIDEPLVRGIGARLVRYPVRAARLEIESARVVVETAEGGLVGTIAREDEIPFSPPRRVFVADAAVWEIPWKEDPPERIWKAEVVFADDTLVTATFGGAVAWTGAVTMEGRTHRCGVARRHA